jgi:hypothetical protein
MCSFAHAFPDATTTVPTYPVQILPQALDGRLLLAGAGGQVLLRALQVLVVRCHDPDSVLLQQQLRLDLRHQTENQQERS